MRIHHTCLAAVLGVALAAVALAGDSPLRDNHPERYEVQPGDTLWDIAAHFLDDPWLWPEVWHINPEVENPHLIFPGDVLSLVVIDDEPRITIRPEDRVVRLSPEIREEPLERAIPTIPTEAVRPFLEHAQILDREAIDAQPYVVAGADERVISSAGDPVYVRGLNDVEPGQRFAVIREDREVVDPDTDEVLGTQVIEIGRAQVRSAGDPATLELTTTNREVRAGDRLMPFDPRPQPPQFELSPAPEGLEGRIVSALEGVRYIGQYSIVVVNRGTDHGLERGNVLTVLEAPREVEDPYTRERVTLPEERAGELLVFHAMERLSLGIVMRAERHMRVADRVRAP